MTRSDVNEAKRQDAYRAGQRAEDPLSSENTVLARRIKKLEVRNRRGMLVGPGAAGAAALGTHFGAGDWIRGKADGVEEIYHGAKVAAKLTDFGKGDLELADELIKENVDGALAREYFENVESGSKLVTGSQEALEAMQRNYAVVPGSETKPVREIRGLKGWIIEKTRGPVREIAGADDKPGESAQINTEQYRDHYDNLAELRQTAVLRREELRGEMGHLAEKLQKTELNTGEIDGGGVEALEGLVREYNQASEVLGEIRGMEVDDIFQGRENTTYASTLEKADNYGIQPFQPGAFADVAIVGADIAAGIAGYVVAKKASRAYHAAGDAVRGVANVAGKVKDGIGRAYGVVSKSTKGLNNRIGKLRHGRKDGN